MQNIIRRFLLIGVACLLTGTFFAVVSYRSSVERPFTLAPIDMANPPR